MVRQAGPIVAVILACGAAGQACRAADEPVSGQQRTPGSLGVLRADPVVGRQTRCPVGCAARPAAIFTHARLDLGDLRLYDAADQSVPYALRVLQRTYRRDPYPAKEFNRAARPDGSSELTLDLQRRPTRAEPVEHNEVEITTPGTEFRRHVVVDGSDDGVNWSKLAETELIRFERSGAKRIDGNTVGYPPSRYRQLRVRVFPDKSIDQDPVNVEKVIVVRKIDVPGEMVTREGQLGPREPVMADGGPGSAWIIELGGDRVPCERIEVDVDDSEFARNFHVEAGGPADSREMFQRVYTGEGLWQRRGGQAKQPLIAAFPEVRASRLRLVVTDFRNPPLAIRSVRFSAPARQIVFVPPASSDAQLRLFFGNPDAVAPNYDFARNLPAQLPTPPIRAAVGRGGAQPRLRAASQAVDRTLAVADLRGLRSGQHCAGPGYSQPRAQRNRDA